MNPFIEEKYSWVVSLLYTEKCDWHFVDSSGNGGLQNEQAAESTFLQNSFNQKKPLCDGRVYGISLE